jgi:glycogen operon protein
VWEKIGLSEIEHIRYVKNLIKLRRKMGIFNRKNFFSGMYVDAKQRIKDLAWYTEKGTEFRQDEWAQPGRRVLSYVVSAHDKMFMVIFNANATNIKWKLPNFRKSYKWNLLLDSSEKYENDAVISGGEIWIPAWSVLCFEIKK